MYINKKNYLNYEVRIKKTRNSHVSPKYVTEHILKSLNSYFGKQDNKRIIDDISQEKYVSPYGGYYSLLRINDLAEDNDMLEFAVIGRQHDVLELCFLGRMKG